MFSLRLCLNECDSGITLESTEFTELASKQSLYCLRGTNNFRQGQGTFPFSQGVRALVLLCVEYKLGALESRERSLAGEKGSLAASLDSALSKNSQWLVDMFGSYADGSLRARRLVRRHNPERKRPGPVEIFVNQTILPAQSITIEVGNVVAQTEEQLNGLRLLLLDQAKTTTPRLAIKRKVVEFEERVPITPLTSLFRDAFEEEIAFGLRSISLYDRKTSIFTLKRAFENPSYQVLSRQTDMLNDFIEPQLPDRLLLGLVEMKESALAIQRLGAINIAMVAPEIGSIALVSLLRERYAIDIKAEYHFAHGAELLETILDSGAEPPMLCVVPLAATNKCWQGRFAKLYSPVMLMPESTKKVIAGVRDSKREPQSHSYFVRQHTTASFFYDDLRRNKLAGKRIDTENLLYFVEASRILREGAGEARAVLWFPFHKFNLWFNDCTEVSVPWLPNRHPTNSILFMRRDLKDGRQNARHFSALVRSCWLSLLERPSNVGELASQLSGDLNYLQTLRRIGGLHTLNYPRFKAA